MSTIKLSIGLPVYNGAATLESTLNSIIPQLVEGTELVICDNQSTDCTAKIAKSAARENQRVKYFCNSTNVGFDRNVLEVVNRSCGAYVWFMGDDDDLRPNAISTVLQVLDAHSGLSAIFSNYSVENRESGKVLVARVAGVHTDIYFQDHDEFIQQLGIMPNFFSSVIVNRAVWQALDARMYVGSDWIHFGMLLRVILKRPSYCIADPQVINRGFYPFEMNAANQNGVAVLVLMKLHKIIRNSREIGYSEASVRVTSRQIDKLLPYKIMSAKKNGLSISSEWMRKFIQEFGYRKTILSRNIILLVIPASVYELIWRLYKTPLVQNIYWRFFSRY